MYSKLSIIIAAYNAESTIKTSINSILHLLGSGTKLIVVDDGSNDSTVSMVESFCNKNITIIKNETNCGAGISKNIGIKVSSTEYIGFLDADDWVNKDYYHELLKYMEEHPDVDFVRTGHVYVENKKRLLKMPPSNRFFSCISQDEYIGDVNKSTMIDYGFMSFGIMRNRFIKEHNIEAGIQRTSEDRVFWWNMLLNGGKGVVLPTIGHFYDKSPNPNSLTQIGDVSQLTYIDAYYEILEKVRKYNNTQFINKAIRQFVAMVDFHIKKKERLSPELQGEMYKRITEFISQLSKDEYDFVYTTVNDERKKMLSSFRG